MDKSTNKKTPIIATVATVGIIAIITMAVLFLITNNDKDDNNQLVNTATPTPTTTTPTPTITETPNTTPTTNNQTQTYTKTVQYEVPKRHINTLKVTVTLNGRIIESVITESNYTDHESQEYIGSFKSSLNSVVVGKSIDELDPIDIGGASLTSDAFFDAISQI